MPTDSGARIVAERYRLDGELGRGGMGVVWKAWDTQLQRAVAVKEILLPTHLDERERAEARARVFREARTAARVPHPAVVTVHDVFDFEDNPWVVMEILPGRSLEDILAAGPMTAADVAAMARPLLDGLREAHARGVVHRDIKPGNIMIDGSRRVVITDFGIATAEGDASITRTGALVGSPEYMPPERLESQPATPAGDLWSVGVTLYAALSGASPFRRTTLTSTIAAVISGPIAPLPQAGPLEELVARLLERNPDERLDAESALQMLDSLPPVAAASGPGEQGGGDGAGAAGAAAAGAAGAGLLAGGTPAGGNPSSGGHPGGPEQAAASGGLPPSGGTPPPFGPTGGTPAHGAAPPPFGPTGGTPAHGAPAEPPHGQAPPPWGPPGPPQGPPPGPPLPPWGPPGPPDQAFSAAGAPPPPQQAPRKKSRALPIALGVGGCGLVFVLLAAFGLIAMIANDGGPPAEPLPPAESAEGEGENGEGGEDEGESGEEDGSDGAAAGPHSTYSNDWYDVEYPADWEVYEDNLEADDTGMVSFYDPSTERRLSVMSWDNTDGYGSLRQLTADDEDAASSGDYEDYETLALESVGASELPQGWGSDHDVATVVNTYGDDSWENQERYVAEYNVVVGNTGYALALNVPEDEEADYTPELEHSLNSWVLK